jgi:UDP-N-acetylmuramate dehydrogenase
MIKIQKRVSLTQYTTFHIGGPADYFIVANSSQDIIAAVSWARSKGLPFFVLGLGANILVGDKGFRGLVIKNESKKASLRGVSLGGAPNDVLMTAELGITIEELIHITSEKGLSGFEHFAGIPSTLGGALWQNLHFLSPDRKETVFIGEIVESAEILHCHSGEEQSDNTRIDSGLARIAVPGGYFKFGYDYSILHDTQDIVLSATLRLKKEDPKTTQERINANLLWRLEKHPEYAWRSSAGSVFKKIEGYGAGRLLESVGLKGFAIGGAKFSEKHANFIVNTGNAAASDIRTLIELAQKKVKEKFSLDLQTEISFVGEF